MHVDIKSRSDRNQKPQTFAGWAIRVDKSTRKNFKERRKPEWKDIDASLGRTAAARANQFERVELIEVMMLQPIREKEQMSLDQGKKMTNRNTHLEVDRRFS